MKEMKVYRIELQDRGDSFIADPKIPNKDFAADGEDLTTPRLCVAPTIIGCIYSFNINSMISFLKIEDPDKSFNIYLYSASVPVDIIEQPTTLEVPDVFVSGELWVMQPIRMHMEAKYRVRRHMRLERCLSRFAFTKEHCDEVIDRIIGSPIYGDLDSFSMIEIDKGIYDERLGIK